MFGVPFVATAVLLLRNSDAPKGVRVGLVAALLVLYGVLAFVAALLDEID